MGNPMVIKRGVLGLLLAAGLAGGEAWGKSFQVYPPPEASAYFRLYQDQDLTTGIGSPVGGLVYVTLYIRLGPATRVHENTESITVTVTDEYPNYWEGTNVVKEFDPFGIGDSSGWDRKAESASIWTGSPGPGHGANGLEETVFYRRTVLWNSMTEPLGNNGEHRIASTPIWFVGSAGGDPFNGGPAAVKAETENVYITDVECSNGTIDYFKWDPDSADESLHAPVVSFTIRDAAPSAKYRWTLWYRETGLDVTNLNKEGKVQPIWGGTYWGVYKDVPNPGGSGTVKVDVPLASPTEIIGQHLQSGVHEWGTYTYDIMVSELDVSDNVIDCYIVKTPYTLWVEPEDAVATNFQSGHAVRYAVRDNAVRLDAVYKLHDQWNTAPTDLVMIPIDPLLNEQGAAPGPTALNTMHGGADGDGDHLPDWLDAYTFADTDPGGRWRIVWTGEAATGRRSAERRTHDAQRMPATNQRLVRPEAFNNSQGGDYQTLSFRKGRKTGVGPQSKMGYAPLVKESTPKTDFLKGCRHYRIVATYGHGDDETYQSLFLGSDEETQTITTGDLAEERMRPGFEPFPIRSALHVHCFSYQVAEAMHGTGAEVAVGWDANLAYSRMNNWGDVFWPRLRDGDTVANALYEAAKAAAAIDGDYYNYQWYGNASMKVTPAE